MLETEKDVGILGMEYELKYGASPGAQAAIREELRDFTEITMETAYYDTPDGALAARKITLRCRKENGVAVCTVKTPAGGNSRGEWEIEWDDIHTAVPKLCKLGGPEELLSLTKGALVQVCGARFTRLAKRIDLPNAVAELALDRGVLLGGGKEAPLCEIEVELKSGSRQETAEYAAALAARYGLQPEPKSKFRRALALAKGE